MVGTSWSIKDINLHTIEVNLLDAAYIIKDPHNLGHAVISRRRYTSLKTTTIMFKNSFVSATIRFLNITQD